MLSILISRSREKNHFQGLVPHLVDGGLLILQYTDDTILFLENDLGQARNLKLYYVPLNSCQASRSISIRVRCFVLEKQMTMQRLLHNFLDVSLVLFPSHI